MSLLQVRHHHWLRRCPKHHEGSVGTCAVAVRCRSFFPLAGAVLRRAPSVLLPLAPTSLHTRTSIGMHMHISLTPPMHLNEQTHYHRMCWSTYPPHPQPTHTILTPLPRSPLARRAQCLAWAAWVWRWSWAARPRAPVASSVWTSTQGSLRGPWPSGPLSASTPRTTSMAASRCVEQPAHWVLHPLWGDQHMGMRPLSE